MFPRRNPFESDMDRIMNMINNANTVTKDLSYDQHVDEETLTITLDVSEYNKEDISLRVDTKDDTSYLILKIMDKSDIGVRTFKKEIALRHKVDESSAEAEENNGILTIKMDINESGNFINIE